MSQPTLETALSEAFDQLREEIHTALPGRVERYDAATQTADVKPLVKVEGQSLPVLPSIPVAFPRGGGFFVSFPLVPGDFVFVLFAESSLDLWRARGGAETSPGDVRRHSLTGAVALPCLYPDSRKLASAHASHMVVGADSGPKTFYKADQIAIGAENPAGGASKGNLVDSFISKFYNMFSTWTTTPNDGGAALKARFLAEFPTPPTSVQSAVVKIE